MVGKGVGVRDCSSVLLSIGIDLTFVDGTVTMPDVGTVMRAPGSSSWLASFNECFGAMSVTSL